MATAAPAPSNARQSGVEALAEQLYGAHRARLLAIARRNSANAEEAEEALQDAFVLFIDHFDPASEAPPLAWLTLTLKRRCWALYRLQRRVWQQRSEQDGERCSDEELCGDSARQPGHLLDLAEKVAVTRSQMAELKRDERRALSLFALGYSYREICELTKWTYTKVNRCVAEGRARLRELTPGDEK